MKIETSINIRKDLFQKLEKASFATGVSKSKIIVQLLKKIRKHRSLNYSFFQRIEYQKKEQKNLWKCLHITIFANEYELMMDMRKIYKKSISFLIASAIIQFLKDILKLSDFSIFEKLTDNYTISQSLLQNEIICWKIFWGFPRDQLILLDNSNQS